MYIGVAAYGGSRMWVICGWGELNRDLVPLSVYYIFTKFKSLAFRQKKVHSNPINTDGDIPCGRFSCALGTVENFLLWSWSIEIKKNFCFKFQFWGQICLTIDHFRLIGAKKIFHHVFLKIVNFQMGRKISILLFPATIYTQYIIFNHTTWVNVILAFVNATRMRKNQNLQFLILQTVILQT